MQDIKNICLAAPFTSYSGYGQYARSIAAMLICAYGSNQIIKIHFFNLTNELLSIDEFFDISNSKYSNMLEYMITNQQLQNQFFDLFMTVSIPMAFLQKGLVNIGITALAQVDKIHPQLIEHCNRMDEVFVMSEFNTQTLKRSMYRLQDTRQIKINIPVNILPYAYSETQKQNMLQSDITEYINNIPQKYLFLSVGEWLPGSVGNDRKDIGALISTFLRAFANNKQIGLLLKVDQGRSSILSQYVIRQRINEIARGIGIDVSINNVYFISGNLSQNKMKQIYMHNKVKTYVSFTHGQSFGIPIFQFISLTGKPVLIPYHSGMTDYVRPQCCEILLHKNIKVPLELMQSFMREFIIPQSEWYVVDYQYAIFKMSEVISNYKSISQRSIAHKQHLIQNYNIDKISNKLKTFLDKHLISV